MKISILSPPVNMTGGMRVKALYAQALEARGHEVRVFCPEMPKPGLRRQIKSLLKERRLVPWCAKQPSYFDEAGVPLDVLPTETITADQLPDADVVLATWWGTAYWVNALPASKGAKAYFMQDYGAPGQEIEKLVPTWKMPFHFITLTENLRQMIRAHNAAAPVRVVPNAVDSELLCAPVRGKQDKPTVGLLYRTTFSKGMDVAFEAIRQARVQMPDLQVVIYSVHNLSQDILSDPWVRFHHQPKDTDLSSIYSACDAWLFPSRMEGFGLPILEAMACRTPVISTEVGAAPDLIRNDNGRLVKTDDPAAMAVALLEVLNLPDAEWRAMSQTCRDDVLSYTWVDAIDQFEEALIEAASSRDNSHRLTP